MPAKVITILEMAFSLKMVAYDSTSSDEDDSSADEQQVRPSSPLIKKPRNALESSPPDSTGDQLYEVVDPPVAETEETEQEHEQAHASHKSPNKSLPTRQVREGNLTRYQMRNFPWPCENFSRQLQTSSRDL